VLGDDEARIVAAIDHYRDRFEDVGWSEHALYDGIPELVASLVANGDALAVVTTKPENQARKIVEHFPFGGGFARVYGPLDRHEHRSKAEMIAQALDDFGARAEHATMIGDRHFDIEGARANAVRGLGVAWGFGSVEELLDAGAHAIAAAPADVHALLAGERAATR